MSGQPGAGCSDPRNIHSHWCGFCGAQLLFSATACRSLRVVPRCQRCGEQQWRDEIDAATGPNHREDRP